MRRRYFIVWLGGALMWSVATGAQQPAVPVVGFLTTRTSGDDAHLVAAFRQGLSETGYFDGRNVVIEFRRAEGRYDRLPELAADLVRQNVSVISVAGGGTPAALVAKATTTKIPIIFNVGVDPVAAGLVASLNRPGGNVTGVSNLSGAVMAKRLELFHELVPEAAVIALLVNPTNPRLNELETKEVRNAARLLGLQVHIADAGTAQEIDAAFPLLIERRVGAFLLSTDAYLASRRDQIAALAARHAIPAMYPLSEMVKAGGLVSYGYDNPEIYRLVGVYTGRILKGERPADLPVQQSTKFELVINLKTARALGLNVPAKLLALADEVIE
jgi:putative ABC transport system substrate-binding protein